MQGRHKSHFRPSPATSLAERIRLQSPRRSFECAGRMVYVVLAALRTSEGGLAFDVHWMPDRPVRLLAADVETFDRAKRKAVLEITAELRNQK